SVMYSEFVPSPPPTGASRGYGLAAVTKRIYNSYEPDDERLSMFITGDYVVRSTGAVHHTEYNYHEKYLDPENGPVTYNNHSTNMPLIRYADVLLSYSEAVNAINGPTAEAYYGLDRIRTRAG